MNYILLENMVDDGKLSNYILNNYKNIKLSITNGKIELIEKTNIKKITPIIYEIKNLRKKHIILYFKCNEIESQKNVSENLTEIHSTITNWINKYQKITTPSGKNTTNDEVDKLKKELKKVQLENEILKKAVAIFSKD